MMTAEATPDDAAASTVFDDVFWDPHASPRSVWAAILAYPVVILAVYMRSRRLLAVTLLWVVGNTRLASPPETDDAWATRVVRGEQAWLERGLLSERTTVGLMTVGAVVNVFTLRAATNRQPVRTVAGAAVTLVLMFLFFDRMADLYERSERARADRSVGEARTAEQTDEPEA